MDTLSPLHRPLRRLLAARGLELSKRDDVNVKLQLSLPRVASGHHSDSNVGLE